MMFFTQLDHSRTPEEVEELKRSQKDQYLKLLLNISDLSSRNRVQILGPAKLGLVHPELFSNLLDKKVSHGLALRLDVGIPITKGLSRFARDTAVRDGADIVKAVPYGLINSMPDDHSNFGVVRDGFFTNFLVLDPVEIQAAIEGIPMETFGQYYQIRDKYPSFTPGFNFLEITCKGIERG
jgi:hypothetical protein